MRIAFANQQLEKRFFKFVAERKKYEIGGVFFYKFNQIADLHWRRHLKIFGAKYVGVIQDWLICPNISNLPDREFRVSDLSQFVAIAEQTADSRDLLMMHFHTHPSGSNINPSANDKAHWLENWTLYYPGSGHARAAIASVDYNNELKLACHDVKMVNREPKVTCTDTLLRWKWINYKIRKDEKERVKKEA